MNHITAKKRKYFANISPGSGSLELSRVDVGDGGTPPGLVGDPVERIFRSVPAVASQTEMAIN